MNAFWLVGIALIAWAVIGVCVCALVAKKTAIESNAILGGMCILCGPFGWALLIAAGMGTLVDVFKKKRDSILVELITMGASLLAMLVIYFYCAYHYGYLGSKN